MTESGECVANARLLLVDALENGDPPLGPLASLEVMQVLCDLAPDGGPLADPPVSDIRSDPEAMMAGAREWLHRAASCEPDITRVLRIAAALRGLDAARRALAT